MSHVDVEPDGTLPGIWKLFVNTYAENQFAFPIIAQFYSVKEVTNAAYLSLNEAFTQRLGWDANEYLTGR